MCHRDWRPGGRLSVKVASQRCLCLGSHCAFRALEGCPLFFLEGQGCSCQICLVLTCYKCSGSVNVAMQWIKLQHLILYDLQLKKEKLVLVLLCFRVGFFLFFFLLQGCVVRKGVKIFNRKPSWPSQMRGWLVISAVEPFKCLLSVFFNTFNLQLIRFQL